MYDNLKLLEVSFSDNIKIIDYLVNKMHELNNLPDIGIKQNPNFYKNKDKLFLMEIVGDIEKDIIRTTSIGYSGKEILHLLNKKQNDLLNQMLPNQREYGFERIMLNGKEIIKIFKEDEK